MKLKRTDFLDGRNRSSVQVILLGAFQAKKARSVGTERKIETDRADRRAIANTESGRLHHIVEVSQVLLTEAEAERVERTIYVARVVENHAAYVIAKQREA